MMAFVSAVLEWSRGLAKGEGAGVVAADAAIKLALPGWSRLAGWKGQPHGLRIWPSAPCVRSIARQTSPVAARASGTCVQWMREGAEALADANDW